MSRTIETSFAENDHWTTPERVWRPLHTVMGGIGLDPFWNPHSKVPSREKWTNWSCKHRDLRMHHVHGGYSCVCPNHRGVVWGVDSFERSWDGFGLVFVNGPFSATERYLRDCAQKGDEVVVIFKANVNARYWHKYVRPADLILTPERRYAFGLPSLPKPVQAPFHCQLAYWGTRPELFREAFAGEGFITAGDHSR